MADIAHIGRDKANLTVEEALANAAREDYTDIMVIGVRRKDDTDEIELIASNGITFERGVFHIRYVERRMLDRFMGAEE